MPLCDPQGRKKASGLLGRAVGSVQMESMKRGAPFALGKALETFYFTTPIDVEFQCMEVCHPGNGQAQGLYRF